MKKFKQLLALLTAGATILCLAGCSSSSSTTETSTTSTSEESADPVKMTFILKSLGSNYWVQLKAGAVDKAAELGIELEVLAPSSDTATEDQIRMLEDQTVGDVDLVLVAPSNSSAQVATFDKVVDAGIPLICVDTNAADYDKKVAFIGSSNQDVGTLAGEYIVENVDPSGTVIILSGQLGDETSDTRTAGCVAALEAAGFTDIVQQLANNDRSTAMSVMENMIQSTSSIAAVYATNDEMALGAARAFEAAGITGVEVVGTNADVDALTSIVEGTGVTASVRQDPYLMGATAIETALSYLSGESVDAQIIVPVRVIDIVDAQVTLDEVNAVLNAA